ncbi:ATP-binding protein [Streptomyces sp. ISL-98]|uniref:ATP-binding protein n=1 Tax=Streptomyces sp. ISL-98 TaxID=2819192 RepID=UPI001BEC5B69|nr:ATP-binding protein [Streptomyces sp. ISL-98]MBT2509991.1 ATP-binding protein [Streptomyces sp. ISL-98]
MKSEIHAPQLGVHAARFSQQLSSTRRGARLARLLAVQQLADWGWARDSETVQTAALLVAELATNAVTHGRVPGRNFLLTLAVIRHPGETTTLRIEVADCGGERPPVRLRPESTAEHGRGLLLVEALSARWGAEPRPPSGKTVWAELCVSGGHAG